MVAEPNRATIHISAPPEEVFGYFTTPEALTEWMGDYAVLDPRPGGEFSLNVQGTPIRGGYLEIDPPNRLVISWGHAGSELLPPGSSTVEVTLSAHSAGTTVTVVHSGLPEQLAKKNAAGWVHYLARLAAAASGANAGLDISPT